MKADLTVVAVDSDLDTPLQGVQATLQGFGFSDRVQYTDPNGETVFSLVDWDVTLGYVTLYTILKGYLNQKVSIYPGTGLVTLQLKTEYVPPPSTPPPPPAGESLRDRAGRYCGIYETNLFGSTFYYLRHDTQGPLTGYDSSIDDIWDRVGDFPQCGSTDTPPVLPPADTALGSLVTNEAESTRALVNTVSGMQTTGLNEVAAKEDGILDIISKTVVGGLNDISGMLSSVMSTVTSIGASLSESRIENQKGFADLGAWQTGFTWPDWNATIVGPIDVLLQPARDTLSWTQSFTWPDWNAIIVTPVVDAVDVWFSGILGIDPAKPFWDEITAKLVDLFANVFDAVMDRIVPPPPEVK